MKLLLLLILSITTSYAQEKVLGVDIPKDFIVEYNEWDNIYEIYSSNIFEAREELQSKGGVENNYILGTIRVIGDTNISLYIYNFLRKDPEYQNIKENSNAIFYIKNNDKILKKEMEVYLIGESGYNALTIAENPLYNLDLSFIIDNLNENSTLRIKDFVGNVFEYEGKELKPLLDTIKLYKQLKRQL